MSSSLFNNFGPVEIPLASIALRCNTDPFLKVYLRPMGEDYLLRLNNLNDLESTIYTVPIGLEVIEELTLTAN